ncbi:MAG: DNA polymerase subunit beta [Thermoprotei archaeon]|nr:MAG: DNA polymerase subunit beta [Thermoprotei archaeon]
MKPLKVKDKALVKYSREHWDILKKKRIKAIKLLQAFRRRGLVGYVNGSVARGDVHRDSDIDIVFLHPVPTFMVEDAIYAEEFHVSHKEIVQATPSSTPKAYIYLDEETCIHIPLGHFTPREEEFYRFGGIVSLKELLNDVRVPGVNKKLLAIIPVEEGHVEFSVIGVESYVADILGISVDTIYERVKMLLRRDEKGRTGVFIKKILPADANIEEEARKLARSCPSFRKRIRELLS